MPKKIPMTEKRQWLEDFDAGEPAASIAKKNGKALKVIKRGIDEARAERDGAAARAELRAALRRAGASEIHLRVSCPPIRHPCFYGIDFPTSEELIAHNRTVEQIRDFLEVDSVAYLTMEGLLACMNRPADDYCTACWSGRYKVPIDQPQSKFSFERDQLKMF